MVFKVFMHMFVIISDVILKLSFFTVPESMVVNTYLKHIMITSILVQV